MLSYSKVSNSLIVERKDESKGQQLWSVGDGVFVQGSFFHISNNYGTLDVAGSQKFGNVILYQFHGKINQSWSYDGNHIKSQLTNNTVLTVSVDNAIVMMTLSKEMTKRDDLFLRQSWIFNKGVSSGSKL